MGKVRQHINPLKQDLQVVTPPLKWDLVFNDPSLPLVVDVGCGYGRFILKLARVHSIDRNYIGMEIRTPIIARANECDSSPDPSTTNQFIPAPKCSGFQRGFANLDLGVFLS